MNFSQFTVISDRSLYKRRKSRQDFAAELEPEEEMEELTRDEILQLNRMKNRYSRRQIRSFVLDRMEDGSVYGDQRYRVFPGRLLKSWFWHTMIPYAGQSLPGAGSGGTDGGACRLPLSGPGVCKKGVTDDRLL